MTFRTTSTLLPTSTVKPIIATNATKLTKREEDAEIRKSFEEKGYSVRTHGEKFKAIKETLGLSKAEQTNTIK